jgi:hypothetical protein
MDSGSLALPRVRNDDEAFLRAASLKKAGLTDDSEARHPGEGRDPF